MQFLHIDHVGPLPPDAKGNTYLLTACDQFTRYTWAMPCKGQDAVTTMDLLLRNIIYPFGLPDWIYSDKAQAFASQVMYDICTKLGVKKAQTTGYQPQSNSPVERFHSYLNQALTICVGQHKENWHMAVDAVLFAHRITPNRTTGHSPFFLMFGRQPKLPIAVMLRLTAAKKNNSGSYINDMTAALASAYTAVRDRQRADRLRTTGNPTNLKREDAHQFYRKGDWVLLFEPESQREPPTKSSTRTAPKPRKLTNRWTGPHMVYNHPFTTPNTCYILHLARQQLLKTNVNRLHRWRPWSDHHLTTDAPQPSVGNDPPISVNLNRHLEGDLMIIRAGDDPFWVVKLIERRPHHPNGHLVQFFENTRQIIADVYLPGWLDPKHTPVKYYYRATPTHHQHAPFTNDTSNTPIFDRDIMDIDVTLTDNNHLTAEVLQAIRDHPLIQWGKTPPPPEVYGSLSTLRRETPHVGL